MGGTVSESCLTADIYIADAEVLEEETRSRLTKLGRTSVTSESSPS
jgi:hypothetical protein